MKKQTATPHGCLTQTGSCFAILLGLAVELTGVDSNVADGGDDEAADIGAEHADGRGEDERHNAEAAHHVGSSTGGYARNDRKHAADDEQHRDDALDLAARVIEHAGVCGFFGFLIQLLDIAVVQSVLLEDLALLKIGLELVVLDRCVSAAAVLDRVAGQVLFPSRIHLFHASHLHIFAP